MLGRVRPALIGLVVAILCPRSAVAVPARDAIDLSQATVYNSPGDVASWPITHSITGLLMQPSGTPLAGLSFTSSALAVWPNYTPPGWDGPLQYTVWAVVNINGHWYTSGFIQMWNGRPSTGGPILTDFAINWAYDGRWGPMQGHQPVVGEQMGFFLTAGNARGVTTVTSVRERTNVVMVSLPANDTGTFTFPAIASSVTLTDVDGDGKDDIGVYRTSNGNWQGLASSTNYTTGANINWGTAGDIPVPGDYDGDGKVDLAVWRPSNGVWYVLKSSTSYGSSFSRAWGSGALNDVPIVGDFDGDGKADLAVWRPGTGVWHILTSGSGYTQYRSIAWGAGSMNDIPMACDFDGDGKADLTIWRPGTGVWYVLTSSSGYTQASSLQWGIANDIPVPGDYDGDGKTDIGIWRPSNGTWYILTSRSFYGGTIIKVWGSGSLSDWPVVADFDGDGKSDIAIWRPGTGGWFVLLSRANYGQALQITLGSGALTDRPLGTPVR